MSGMMPAWQTPDFNALFDVLKSAPNPWFGTDPSTLFDVLKSAPNPWFGTDPSTLFEGLTRTPNPWLGALASAMPAPQTASSGNLQALGLKVDPSRMLALQTDYVRELTELWMAWSTGKRGPSTDRRFGSETWTGPYGFFADLYLLNARFVSAMADAIDADEKTKAKVRFAISQWVDAMAPSNFLALNPDALKKLIETNGQSLRQGLSLFLADAQKGRVRMTDESAFEVGRNVAFSEGSVVFENEIFQLIQYRPLTDTVHEKPLLMVPPCINKYYILDLQPENSVVRHAVESGHTVFLMSWRNPMAEQAALTWDDYVEDGIIRAIDVVREISNQKTINILGFCVGGTMLTTALAVLAGREKGVDAQPAASLTLLTTLLDFSDTGVLDVFIDEAGVQRRERTLGGMNGGKVGLMPAKDLAQSFAFLRPNDLVWNYVVSSYLKGEPPPPFDLLFWNADSTNLPGPYFAWYLRNTYLENKLMQPGAVEVCGVPVDFGRIEAPVFIYGSREDHIVPWTAAYASTQLLKGPKRFVLGGSGHIAGVINPPAKKKRSHWVFDPKDDAFPPDAGAWLEAAKEVPGSWWPEWTGWLADKGGKRKKVKAAYGNAKYQPIEPAPGRYVQVRAV